MQATSPESVWKVVCSHMETRTVEDDDYGPREVQVQVVTHRARQVHKFETVDLSTQLARPGGFGLTKIAYAPVRIHFSDAASYAPGVVQHELNGGRFGVARSSARTPHGGASYVCTSWQLQNQEKCQPETHYRSFPWSGGPASTRPTAAGPRQATRAGSMSPQWGSIRCRPLICTHAPWGCIVVQMGCRNHEKYPPGNVTGTACHRSFS